MKLTTRNQQKMNEPSHIDFTALVEGWGYYISYREEDLDGIAPTLMEAFQKVLETTNEMPAKAEPPTCEELLEDKTNFESVSRETDDSWRHGVYVDQTFLRKTDNTYWSASYRLSNDGETNELREGTASIVQVYPVHKITTQYNVVNVKEST